MPPPGLTLRHVSSCDPAELARLRAVLRSSHRRRPQDVEGRRAELERFAERLPDRQEVEGEPTTIGGVEGEWLGAPSGTGVVLYFHGGGYVTGSPGTHRQLAFQLAKASGARLFVPAFRRAPECPFPAAFDDAKGVWEALTRSVEPPRVVLGGDSAGGGLALALAADLAAGSEALPSGAFGFSPWTDLTHGSRSIDENRGRDPVVDRAEVEAMAAIYLRSHASTDPRASPLFARHAGMPPLRILVSDVETLRDDGIRFARRAAETGVSVELEIWEGQPHAWPIYAPFLADGLRAIRDTGRWIRRLLEPDPSGPDASGGGEEAGCRR